MRSTTIAWIALAGLVSQAGGCATVAKDSARETATCAGVSKCPVFGLSGDSETACVINGEQVIYPGQPDWPFSTPGVCDAVRNGKIVSTRDLGPEKPPADEP